MFTLQVYTLNLAAGKEQPDLPGILAAAPPRRTGRNRNQDLLTLYLKFEEPQSFAPAQKNELLAKLAAIFYRTSGSVTAAMRATASSLNDFLLARNLRSTREGGQVVAVLSMTVLHGDLVYLAHCGPTYSFVLGREEVQANRDTQMGRGLGLSRTLPIRFFQAKIEDGDIILLSHKAPPSWRAEAFTGSPKLGLEGLRRRLLNQAGADLQAVLVRVLPGKGEVTSAPLPGRQWPERETPPAAAVPAAPPQPEAAEKTPEPAVSITQPAAAEEQPAPEPAVQLETPAPSVEVEASLAAAPVEEAPAADTPPAVETESPVKDIETPTQPDLPPSQPPAGLAARFAESRRRRTAPPQPIEGNGEEPVDAGAKPQGMFITGQQWVEPAAPEEGRNGKPAAAEAASPASVTEDPPNPPKPVRRVERKAVWKPLAAKVRSFFTRARFAVAKAWLGGDAAQQKVSTFGRKAIARMTPVSKDEPAKLTPGTLFFLAVAVPLIISAAAATVYIRNGYGEQHRVYLTQAQQFADLAAGQPDPVLKRNNLTQSLQFIDRADEYGQSTDSASLRAEVQQAMDIMDGVRRLEMVPASPTPFDAAVNIVRMVTGPGEDIYVLDGTEGRILRLVYTRPGYEVDKQFLCGPGQVGVEGLIVSPLIDLAPVRGNSSNAPAVMGIDEAGNILYCGPGRSPEAITLVPPDSGWPKLSNITLANNVLYVLDTEANGVWRYSGDGEVFSDPPRLFFDNEIPVLEDVTDLAVYQDDLFLLHADGTMTKCTFSGFDFSPTRCTMQVDYNLQRDGLSQNAMAALESPVIQMQSTDSPAYSLFLFSSEGPTLYHFSLALNLQYQYRPRLQGSYELPDRQATAFFITANRRVLIAFGNEVFYTELVP
ncbi:MAG TPA: hypothetical protein VFF68_07985 [Anaerolineaceae bacterium]|nr:hypothetical protein [Anaerolineaceae bacterium]